MSEGCSHVSLLIRFAFFYFLFFLIPMVFLFFLFLSCTVKEFFRVYIPLAFFFLSLSLVVIRKKERKTNNFILFYIVLFLHFHSSFHFFSFLSHFHFIFSFRISLAYLSHLYYTLNPSLKDTMWVCTFFRTSPHRQRSF
jgi:hypothetical protein